MNEFKKEDVLVMARAILMNGPIQFADGDFVTYLWCYYCDSELHGYQYGVEDFKHELSCPVLIAQDILTGNT